MKTKLQPQSELIELSDVGDSFQQSSKYPKTLVIHPIPMRAHNKTKMLELL